MVGEMRDLKPFPRPSPPQNGPPVLGTLHTGSAARTVDRVLDVFPVEQRDQIRIMVSANSCAASFPSSSFPGRTAAAAPSPLKCSSHARHCQLHPRRQDLHDSRLHQTGKAQGMILMDDSLRAPLPGGAHHRRRLSLPLGRQNHHESLPRHQVTFNFDTFLLWLLSTNTSNISRRIRRLRPSPQRRPAPKIRVNGTISAISDENLEGQAFKTLLSEICDPQAFQKYLEEGDLDFAYEMDETSRFRCNYFKQQHGLGAVFRLIPTKIATLEELGVPTVVKEFAHMRSGLVLVTGPTGSGKSTTLAAIIDYINSNHRHGISRWRNLSNLVHPNKKSIVTQREVPCRRSFADGLAASSAKTPTSCSWVKCATWKPSPWLTAAKPAFWSSEPCTPTMPVKPLTVLLMSSLRPAVTGAHHARGVPSAASWPSS